MKSTVSLVALAILALGPVTQLQAQHATPRPKAPASAASKSPASAPAPKTSISPTSATSTSSAPATAATPASATPTARTDVYHVIFTKAALGKATQLAESLKAPNPQALMPGHSLVLRHQDGDSWDYAVIQHAGTSTTVDATRPTPPPSSRDLSDWHNDTFVNGPSWEEFSKAMGIDESSDKSKTSGSVYVVSVYRPAPGHRDQLETILGQPPQSGDTSVGNVLMQHLEGGPWTFLTIVRYNSWQDFGTNESNSVASSSKNEGGWFQLRDHVAFHNDTLTDRISP
jgi:hypothetical protein